MNARFLSQKTKHKLRKIIVVIVGGVDLFEKFCMVFFQHDLGDEFLVVGC